MWHAVLHVNLDGMMSALCVRMYGVDRYGVGWVGRQAGVEVGKHAGRLSISIVR